MSSAMHDVDTTKLKFHVSPMSEKNEVLFKAYKCWKECWSQAYSKEMGLGDELFSDSFDDKDILTAVMYGGEIASFSTLKVFDLQNPIHLDHSYFSVWPKELIEQLKQEQGKIFATCNFTVSFNYRRHALGVSWKDLYCAAIAEYVKHSDFLFAVGTPRIEKGVNKSCERTGAVALAKDLPYSIEGQRIDIIRWSKDADNLKDPVLKELVLSMNIGGSKHQNQKQRNCMYPNYEIERKEIIDLLKSIPNDRQQYANYLAQTYYYVNHSEKLLALAASRMNEEDRGMQRRFFKHLAEENAHDLMAKKDLENLDFKLEQFPEMVETKMFWETQYYKIEHMDPAALMGYILLLEDIAAEVCIPMFQEVEKNFGRKCGTFLKVHGEEDPGHVADAFKVIDSLDEKRRDIVKINLEQSAVAFKAMIKKIASK